MGEMGECGWVCDVGEIGECGWVRRENVICMGESGWMRRICMGECGWMRRENVICMWPELRLCFTRRTCYLLMRGARL